MTKYANQVLASEVEQPSIHHGLYAFAIASALIEIKPIETTRSTADTP